ncbi:hypothetical protein LDENG_00098630, partial [Lucifuga dentata]
LCCLSSCVPQHIYTLIQTPKTWHEAHSFCREKCIGLATIDDMGEMETMLKTVENKYDDAVWIGLYKGKVLKWHWSLADKDFYKTGERDFLTWGSQADFNCASFKGGKMYRIRCDSLQYSVCFDGRKLGREQYVLTNTKMTWTEAQDHCRRYYTDLVSVRNEVENQMIMKVASDLEVWIGLFRDPWKWSDNSNSSFRYWRPSQTVYPSKMKWCIAMIHSESGKWGDRSCKEMHPFICNCEYIY